MLKKSSLVPVNEPQLLTYEQFNSHSSEEHKWEYFDGFPFNSSSTFERDMILLMALYSSGLKHFIELLPIESKEMLIQLLQEDTNKKNWFE